MPEAAILPAVRFIPHSGNYKVGLKPVPVPGKPPSVCAPRSPLSDPAESPRAPQQVSPERGSGSGEAGYAGPRGKGRERPETDGLTLRRLPGGGAGRGPAALSLSPALSQGLCPGRGQPGYKGRKAGAGPAAGKLQLHLPPREKNREIPSAGKRPVASAWCRGSVRAEGLSPGAVSRQSAERRALRSLPVGLAV
ncbi:unnamed protein product [Coccothraustes coccothraustes]